MHSYHEQETPPQQTGKVRGSSENFCPPVVQVACKEKTRDVLLTQINGPWESNSKDSENWELSLTALSKDPFGFKNVFINTYGNLESGLQKAPS